jgi:hypothetical protein
MPAMSHRTIAIVAVVGALAVGGTALAAGGGGLLGGDRDQNDALLAKDLASKLHGVSSSEVQTALGQVRDERRSERRKQAAAAIAAELDGVSQGDVEKALAKLEASHERAERSEQPGQGPGFGRRGDRVGRRGDGFAAALAKELGKSPADVRKALRAARTKQFKAQLDQAVKDGRLTQAQANQIEKRFKNGPPGFRRGRAGSGPHGGGPPFGGPGPGFGGPPPGDVPPGE